MHVYMFMWGGAYWCVVYTGPWKGTARLRGQQSGHARVQVATGIVCSKLEASVGRWTSKEGAEEGQCEESKQCTNL